MKWANSLMGQLKPSATLAVKARATELKREGKEIIDLSTGEPDQDTPDHIKAAAYEAMKAGHTKYCAVPGIVELREALAEKFQVDNRISATPDSIIVTNGGKQALHEAFQVTLEPGDEVIIPAPFWVSYPAMVTLAGGIPVVVKTSPESGYRLTPEQLEEACTPRTRAVIVNSPSNPTGAAYTAAQLAALGAVIEGKDRVFVVSDEVYEKIVYDGFEFASVAAAAPAIADRVITVNAFSKAYSMTGWRVGYATGPAEVIKAMSKFQSQTTSNVNTPSQYAALAALRGPHEFLKAWKASFANRIELAMNGIKEIAGLDVAAQPEGAFYLFFRIDELLNSDPDRFGGSVAVATYLLENAGVALVPGAAFGDDGAIRMSVAAADDSIRTGIERMRSALM